MGCHIRFRSWGLIRKALTEKESDEDGKRHMMGALGLILLVLGTRRSKSFRSS